MLIDPLRYLSMKTWIWVVWILLSLGFSLEARAQTVCPSGATMVTTSGTMAMPSGTNVCVAGAGVNVTFNDNPFQLSRGIYVYDGATLTTTSNNSFTDLYIEVDTGSSASIGASLATDITALVRGGSLNTSAIAATTCNTVYVLSGGTYTHNRAGSGTFSNLGIYNLGTVNYSLGGSLTTTDTELLNSGSGSLSFSIPSQMAVRASRTSSVNLSGSSAAAQATFTTQDDLSQYNYFSCSTKADAIAAAVMFRALVIPADYSDAPATFGSPFHEISGSLKLGSNAPDSEAAAQPNATATGDDTTGIDDEDGILSFPALVPGATSYSIPAANISASGTGTLHAWVDFNKDGLFRSNEYRSVAVTNGVLAGPLSWSGFTAVTAGTTYARFRFTSTTLSDNILTLTVDERATVAAANGEVEDYAIAIATPIDLSDAPSSYGAPTHTISGSLKLGANAPDAETILTPLDGTGDDLTGTDDEDGVSAFPPLPTGATSYSIPAANISATGTGTLHAWIDFDKNGAFTAAEYQSVAVTSGTLAGPLSWTGITVASAGTTYARFRFTSTALTDNTSTTVVDERATMAAANGEVEDYQLTIVYVIPNVTQTCAIRDGKNYTSGNPRIWWDVNSYAIPGNMEENNVPLLLASGSAVSFGAGLAATKVSSYWSISNVDATTAAQARANNEYLQVSFTTQSSITSYLERWGTYTATSAFPGIAIDIATQPDFSDVVNFYDGGYSGSNFHYFTGNGDQLLEAGKTYYVRAYFYGASSGGLDSIGLQIGSCSDFGDIGISSEAFHAQATPQSLYLGITKPDTEVSAQDAAHGGSNGTGDGADEDGISSFPPLYASMSSYSIPAANITATGTGTLHAWIDFDKNGAFTAAEYKSVAVTSGTLAGPLSWTGLTVGSAGTTYARFRFTSTALTDNTSTTAVDERATMAAANGEVEDYAVTIVTLVDSSDAPASYGASTHTISGSLKLGANAPDAETILTPLDGTGDDLTGTDDEDGVSAFPSLTVGASSYSIPAANITATGTGTLHAWIDFDKNGAFTAAEYKSVAVTSGTLAGPLSWTGLTVGSAGTTYARFRFTSTALTDNTSTTAVDERATMAAANGEVEDYAVTIHPTGVITPVPPTTCGNLLTAEFDGSFGTLASGTRDLQTPPGGGYTYTGDLMASGLYTVVSKIGSPSIHVAHWRNIIGVNTGTDDDAYLAVNGSTAVGVFYKQTIALQANRGYRISLFAINAVSGSDSGGDPELGIRLIRESNGAVVATTSTGVIPEKYPTVYGGYQGPQDWTQGTIDLTTPATDNYRLEVFNISTAAGGNDFAIDGISIAPLTEAGCPKDYSDAPTATLGGASHAIVPSLYLGASVTADTADYNSANADGDVDNGVTMPSLIQGASVNIPISVTQPSANNGYLQAWVDWNGDGDFADAGEQIASNLQYSAGSSGTINLPVTVPLTTTTSQTYARFRWSSTSNLSATAAAIDGEVEDYALTVVAPLVYPAAASEAECPVAAGVTFTPSYQVGWNHGGADPYASTLQLTDIASTQSAIAGSGISYLIDASSGRILNANQSGRVNAYQAGDYAQYSFTTSASVSAGRFWKGLRYGVMSTASIHTPYKISVLASTDPSFTAATLLLDGHTVTAPASGYVQTEVPFTASAYLLPATTYYVRVIFHDATSSSGELRWDDLVLGFANCHDYSDAPTSSTSYGSASHAVLSGGDLRLGGDIDAESTGLASTNADGDDTVGLDDEDSLSSLPSLSTSSRQYNLNLPVSNASGSTARLVGWIDFNRNGAFDTNEAATINVANGANNKTVGLTWKNLPSAMQTGTTYLRLRLTTDPSIATGTASTSQATGLAFDGEVEDYVLTISNGGVSVSGTVYHDLNVDGAQQAEPGIGEVTMVLYDSTNNTCRSTQTNAQGQYRFDQVAAGNYSVYEAAAEALPQPNTCPPLGADLNAYLSSTPNNQAITVSTASINGIDFADVQKPQFTLEHSQTILPGSTITYPHRFTALVDGTVSFSLADGADPANLNWDVVLYVDTNCNAVLDGGDTELNSAFLMTAGQSLCLVAKVLAPSNVSSGASHILEITSSFTFGDGSLISTPITQTRTDLTRTSAGSPTGGSVDGAGKLKLSKAVWNVSRNIQGDVALPGETLRYLISYENIGNGSLDELAVQDRVPEFTSLTGVPQCGTTPPELTLCSPTVGGLDLEWVFTGKLLPGSQGQVFYEVLVE